MPTKDDDRLQILARIIEWDYHPRDGESAPFEPKIVDWGWIDGRLVALDYSANVG